MSVRGGARIGAGRKPKATEVELIEKLSPLEDSALLALQAGVEAGEYPFVRLFMEYRYGKPKQAIDMSHDLPEGLEIIIGGKNKAKNT